MVLKLFYASKSMMNKGRMPQRQYAPPTSSIGGINSINLSSDESVQRVIIKVNAEYLAKQWLLASTFFIIFGITWPGIEPITSRA